MWIFFIQIVLPKQDSPMMRYQENDECNLISVPLVCVRSILQCVHEIMVKNDYDWPELDAYLGLLSLNCLIVNSICQN